MVQLKDSTTGGLKAYGGAEDPEELDWRLKNSEECGSGREKSETNPSTYPLPFQTGRPAELT